MSERFISRFYLHNSLNYIFTEFFIHKIQKLLDKLRYLTIYKQILKVFLTDIIMHYYAEMGNRFSLDSDYVIDCQS